MLLRICRQYRARNTLQLQTATMVEVFEALRQVGQPGASRTEIRRVDLCQVAQTDHLRSVACARNDGLDLVRREVLRLIYQDEALLEAPAADVVERFE